MSSLLEVRGLTFSRDHRVLAENLDFDVRAGSAIRLEGPNGAGKTTLLRIVAGLYSAYEGEIFYEGQRSLSALRRHSHFLGHAPALKGSLSAHENLDWLASLKGLAASAADIEAALEQVGLGGYEHIQCRQMSAGQ
ncbi:ATP-binding cassette domain-containing protein, partial [Litorivivens sp.]